MIIYSTELFYSRLRLKIFLRFQLRVIWQIVKLPILWNPILCTFICLKNVEILFFSLRDIE